MSPGSRCTRNGWRDLRVRERDFGESERRLRQPENAATRGRTRTYRTRILRLSVLRDESHWVSAERNHQGLGNELSESRGEVGLGRVALRESLGGMLRCVYRMAA